MSQTEKKVSGEAKSSKKGRLGLSKGPKKGSGIEVEERSFFLTSSWWLSDQELSEYKKTTKGFLKKVQRGLSKYPPEMVPSGEGGVYLVRSETAENLAVFKPFDEDPFSPRNPKSPGNFSFDASFHRISGCRAGESTQKEVAAYLLDRGFANVPLATIVRISGGPWGHFGKLGSLHYFIPHLHDSWELSASFYSLSDFQRIAVLDLRLLNTDRHGGNILVLQDKDQNGAMKLVPIDHAFCLPDTIESCGSDLWFEWMSWPQAKLPLLSETLQYVKNINLEADSKTLRALGIAEDAIYTMIWCSTLLMFTLLTGLTLYDTAEIIRYRARSGKDPQISRTFQLACSQTDRYLEHLGFKKRYNTTQLNGILNKSQPRQKSAPHSRDRIWTVLCTAKAE